MDYYQYLCYDSKVNRLGAPLTPAIDALSSQYQGPCVTVSSGINWSSVEGETYTTAENGKLETKLLKG